MGELDSDLLSLRVCKLDDLAERSFLSFVPETGIFRGDAALRDNGCSFYDSQARTAREDPSDCEETRQIPPSSVPRMV